MALPKVSQNVPPEELAFATIVEAHQKMVFEVASRFVPSHDVPEVAHRVFIKVFQSLGDLRNSAALVGWLRTITVRTSYDYWREVRAKAEIQLSDAHLALIDNARSKEVWTETATVDCAKEMLDWCMSKLSPEDRMVVTLVHLEGFSVRETAKELGWSIAKVKVRAFRSRQSLKKMLLELQKKELEDDKKG